jgi:acyl-CoA synthetase (AMP-forming)/AMP-acid ligase II
MVAEPGIHRISVTTLGDLLDLRAAELGEHLALVFPDHQVSYAGLAARADFFARGLLAVGFRPGETVGILLPNCADTIAALFGAAKAGLYPVPVNARYKSLELADLIRHSRMRALFISPPHPANPAAPDFPAVLAEAFPALAGQDRAALALENAPDLRQIVVLGESAPPGFATEADFAAAGAAVPAGDLERRRQLVKVRDPAVVMYTSGTAAEPKGALLSHEASSFLSLSYLTDTLEQRVSTGGHPMPGMECRVVDPVSSADLPPDTEGELLFRGSNCFSGYLNDPELTAQVFDDEGWFHTMDVATMDPDGRVTFISRLKDMLKVGGENVSAAEVESYLLRHPAIAIVQVVSAPDDYYVEVPAAFIQLKPGAAVTGPEIIDFCVGKIATFRVPRYVRFVTEWPMSGTKIKKAILREMIAADLKEEGITRAPRSPPLRGHSHSRSDGTTNHISTMRTKLRVWSIPLRVCG